MKITLSLSIVLTAIIAPLAATTSRDESAREERPASVFPRKTWETREPTAVGLDAKALDAFRDFVGGRGCVVRRGYLVYSWGDVSRRSDVASACKPWYTHFLIQAIEDGKLESVDDRVSRHEPRLRSLNAKLGHKDRDIRWRHLACQSSCYGVTEAPGKAYDYSDYNMALFFDALFLKVYGLSWKSVDEKLVRPRLTDILQCEDQPTFMAFGTGNRPGRVGVSVRDFARFGLLYLHRGRWRERQVIQPKHVDLVLKSSLPNTVPRTRGKSADMIPGQRSIGGGNNQTDHFGSYSFAWWTNGVDREGERHWPDAPLDAYGAFGHGGKRAMVVFPTQELIVSWNDTGIQSREREAKALGLLARAVK